MEHIQPLEQLKNGTKVSICNSVKRGIVVDSEIVPASNGGMICVHTVKLTEKIKVLSANQHEWIKMEKPEVKRINYASIYIRD